jgi:hypothetical protein
MVQSLTTVAVGDAFGGVGELVATGVGEEAVSDELEHAATKSTSTSANGKNLESLTARSISRAGAFLNDR